VKVDTTRLSENAFRIIEAGETITASFDIAATHDLSQGGDFDLASAGAISYAEENSTELAGIISLSSNNITVNINGEQSAKSRLGFHHKRTIVQSDCTGTKSNTLSTSLKHCRDLANAAASAAMSNDAKMVEYFKSNSSSTKKIVADVYTRIVSECGSSTSGVSRLYCSDKYGNFCPGNLAYTVSSDNYLVTCPAYFNQVPLTKTCHGTDQATTTIHEMTHLKQIKGASDYGVYGYKAVQGLTAAQNLNHADTYCLFANGKHLSRNSLDWKFLTVWLAVYAGC
jgi:deuterolysin